MDFINLVACATASFLSTPHPSVSALAYRRASIVYCVRLIIPLAAKEPSHHPTHFGHSRNEKKPNVPLNDKWRNGCSSGGLSFSGMQSSS